MDTEAEWEVKEQIYAATNPPGEFTIKLTRDGKFHLTLPEEAEKDPEGSIGDLGVLVGGAVLLLADERGRQLLRSVYASKGVGLAT